MLQAGGALIIDCHSAAGGSQLGARAEHQVIGLHVRRQALHTVPQSAHPALRKRVCRQRKQSGAACDPVLSQHIIPQGKGCDPRSWKQPRCLQPS